MPRRIVCLTFDFDAWSGLTARGLTTPKPVSRGEFGVVGVGRILDLLRRRGIFATFFIPGIVIETYRKQCDEIIAAGHEIGHRGYTHIPPSTLSPEVEAEGLVRGIECIRRLTGRKPLGYRSPSWDISDRTVDLLLQHDFLYESNLMGNDYTPYYTRRGDVAASDAPLSSASTPGSSKCRSPGRRRLPALRVLTHADATHAAPHERASGARKLDRRLRLHGSRPRLGCHHVYLPSLRDRPRPSHVGAPRRATAARRVPHEDGRSAGEFRDKVDRDEITPYLKSESSDTR